MNSVLKRGDKWWMESSRMEEIIGKTISLISSSRAYKLYLAEKRERINQKERRKLLPKRWREPKRKTSLPTMVIEIKPRYEPKPKRIYYKFKMRKIKKLPKKYVCVCTDIAQHFLKCRALYNSKKQLMEMAA